MTKKDQRVGELESQMQSMKSDHENQIKAMSANDESSRQSIINDYLTKISSLEIE